MRKKKVIICSLVIMAYFMPKLHFFVRTGLSPSNLATNNLIALKRPLGLSPLFIASASLVYMAEIPFYVSCTHLLQTLAIWRLLVTFLRKEGSLQTFVDVSIK